MEDLAQNIEKMREMLYRIVVSKGLRHPDVLIASRVLDQEISKYLQTQSRAGERGSGHHKQHSSEL